jgi:hypothetical protein
MAEVSLLAEDSPAIASVFAGKLLALDLEKLSSGSLFGVFLATPNR